MNSSPDCTNARCVRQAFLIAFTSEFLPKILYQYTENWDLIGYTRFVLAEAPKNTTKYPCMYRDFRDPNGTLTAFFWKLLALRLFFVIIFEVRRTCFPSDN